MDDFVYGCVTGFLTSIGMAVVLFFMMLVSPVAAVVLGVVFFLYMLNGLLGAVGDLINAIDERCSGR